MFFIIIPEGLKPAMEKRFAAQKNNDMIRRKMVLKIGKKNTGKALAFCCAICYNKQALSERPYIAEWSSPVARRAHNPKVVGSNPASATMTSVLIAFEKL